MAAQINLKFIAVLPFSNLGGDFFCALFVMRQRSTSPEMKHAPTVYTTRNVKKGAPKYPEMSSAGDQCRLGGKFF
jgi:hypothetical protein